MNNFKVFFFFFFFGRIKGRWDIYSVVSRREWKCPLFLKTNPPPPYSHLATGLEMTRALYIHGSALSVEGRRGGEREGCNAHVTEVRHMNIVHSIYCTCALTARTPCKMVKPRTARWIESQLFNKKIYLSVAASLKTSESYRAIFVHFVSVSVYQVVVHSLRLVV